MFYLISIIKNKNKLCLFFTGDTVVILRFGK